MKKLLAIVLSLVLVLSLSVVAFADGSPVKTVTAEDLPAESEAVAEATVEPVDSVEDLPEESEAVADADVEGEANAKIVSNGDLNEEQKETVNDAIAAVIADDCLPVDSLYVETDGDAVVTIALDEDAVIYIVDADGNIIKLFAKDLVAVGNGRYEIPVSGSCAIVIAKEA